MLRWTSFLLLLLIALPPAAAAQAVLVPSNRAPYAAKFDLLVPDAQYLFLPQTPLAPAEGPFRFRFRHPALDAVLTSPATVHYLLPREGGFHLQHLHLRAPELPADALGPQGFEIIDGAGGVVGRGTILVLSRPPEPVALAAEDGTRVLELGQPTPVRLTIRTHGNYRGAPRVVNRHDWEIDGLRADTAAATPGLVVLRGELRAQRAGAQELRLSVETEDGREVELAFGGLQVREPAPGRLRAAGGPLYVDALGSGAVRLVLRGFPPGLLEEPRIVPDAAGELLVLRESFDAEARELTVELEFRARAARPPGARELRELVVRAGPRLYRANLEVVGAPTVSGVHVERAGRAVLVIGGEPTLLRISGQNLDGYRPDCSVFGASARCESLGSGPTEIVERVMLGADAPEGELQLPLVPAGVRAEAATRAHPLAVRVQLERPAIPMLLTQPGLLDLNCEELRSCRRARDGESIRVAPEELLRLQLRVDEARIAAAHGWQKLVISVTRVRGEQRQVLRTFGSPAAPRLYRHGLAAGGLSLLDAGADPRHGDQIIIRVEHAAEQYPAEHRGGVAASEAFVRRVYVDGGTGKRLTADMAVQPVLFRFGGAGADGEPARVTTLYPNAGLGLTWQFLDERLEPRMFAAKLQLLATNIRNVAPGGNAAEPAVLLSANLRIPGSDPAKPLVLTGGVAHFWGESPGWRLLAGAGMDLGIARLIFGG